MPYGAVRQAMKAKWLPSAPVDLAEGEVVRAMEFADKILTCVECERTFVFTSDEQIFFLDKHFVHEPRHCKQCRARRGVGRVRVRVETRTTCSECGLETTVPFKPTKGLPVVCRACFQKLGRISQVGPQGS
jgi:CxxC-x17-CxxC domain-containing protein